MTWSWTFPLVLGWFAVGTQTERNSINRTLNRAKKLLEIPTYIARDANPQIDESQNTVLKRAYSWGIDHCRGPFAQSPMTSIGESERFLGFRIAGDMESPGPIFNYARINTWQHVAVSIIDAHFSRRLGPNEVPDKIEELQQHCFGISTDLQNQKNPFHPPPRTKTVVAEEGGAIPLQVRTERANEEFIATDPPGGAVIWFIVASLFHFATTVPAFVTAYYTPPVGLGCRSGSLLLYFCASLVSASFLALSGRISRSWFQLKEKTRHQFDLATRCKEKSVAALAVSTRLFGTCLAYANAVWIVLYCVFEFLGFFQRCWCDALFVVNGNNGWVTFFTTGQIKDAVLEYWIFCVVLSFAVLIGTSFFLWGCHEIILKTEWQMISSGDCCGTLMSIPFKCKSNIGKLFPNIS